MEQSHFRKTNSFSGQKLPEFYGNRKFIAILEKARHLSVF